MSSEPVEVVRHQIPWAICEEHGVQAWIPTCPWPDCPNGTSESTIGVLDPHEVLAEAIPPQRGLYDRAEWQCGEDQTTYSWDKGDPWCYQVSGLFWQEAERQGLIERHPTKVVYHYTSLAALADILSSGEFWLTDYSHLNDNSELTYAFNLAHERFEHVAAKRPTSADVLRQWQTAIQQFDTRVCVASFSHRRDSLSQWRAYGNVAIGYRIESLMLQTRSVWMRTLVYEPTRQMKLLDLLAHLTASAYENDLDRVPANKIESLYRGATALVLQLAVFLKHPDFGDEREMRLAHLESEHTYEQFPELRRPPHRSREAGDLEIPYVTTRDLAQQHPDRLKIEEILIGPGPDADDVERGVRELLQAKGYEAVPVHRSGVPLRG